MQPHQLPSPISSLAQISPVPGHSSLVLGTFLPPNLTCSPQTHPQQPKGGGGALLKWESLSLALALALALYAV